MHSLRLSWKISRRYSMSSSAKLKLVIDEWLWAYLNGDHGEHNQRQTVRFLQAVNDRCDRLVTVNRSAFDTKAWAMSRTCHNDVIKRQIFVLVKAQFLLNSEKLKRLSECDLPDLPDDIAGAVKTDDKYLVRAYHAAHADFLVTTDEPLINALRDSGVRCRATQDFLLDYLSE